MHSFIVITLVLSVAASALAQRRKPDQILSTMFPACKSVGDSMQTKFMDYLRSGQIGPRACKSQNQATCMMNDAKKVRCAVTEKPSQECVAQINTFIQGSDCGS